MRYSWDPQRNSKKSEIMICRNFSNKISPTETANVQKCYFGSTSGAWEPV